MRPAILRARLPVMALVLSLACDSASADHPLGLAAAAPLLSIDEPPRYSDWAEPVHLGAPVSTAVVESDPFISRDGLSLYFTAGQGRGGSGGRDIWVTRRARVGDAWGAPRNLGAIVNSAAHEGRPALSRDGHRLYFASSRTGGEGDFDLYVSRRRDHRDDDGWEPPVNLGSGVNSAASEESGVTILEDDASGDVVLYFSSNRPGGAGEWDIYASRLLPDDTFGPATIVEELSSADTDADPAVRRDGLEMYLASDRPGTSGALDLWVSTRASIGDPWSPPANLGPAINTPPRPPDEPQANDRHPSLSFDGTTLYFASAFRSGNVGIMYDIWTTTRSRERGPN